jgi:hypothetical protein
MSRVLQTTLFGLQSEHLPGTREQHLEPPSAQLHPMMNATLGCRIIAKELGQVAKSMARKKILGVELVLNFIQPFGPSSAMSSPKWSTWPSLVDQ